MKFTHLHTHSHYSLLDGLAKIDDLVARAGELGMDSLALTDHGVMYGAIEFYQKAKAKNIKPIIGVEAYVAVNSRHSKNAGVDDKRNHLILLAKNETGYKNLIKLTTLAHLEGFYYKPRIDKEILKKYSDGIIASSACIAGEVPRAILSGDLKKAENIIGEFQEIFGKENFYLELQHHPSFKEQEEVNKALIGLSKKTGASLIAANDVHYINKEDDKAQDILMCIQMNRTVDEKNRLSMIGDDYSLKSQETMIEHFKHIPEAIDNTQKIVSECNLELELGKILLPHYKVPDNFSPDEYLKKLCRGGIEKRYGKPNEEIEKRLRFELDIIKNMGFASYFLIVQDFVNWSKSRGIVVGPGRGSAAGSIVSYLIGITDIDPLKYDLLFERFLNPDRISMPDIDLDFADNRRDEVLKYVSEKYGKDHVAQIITFGTMAARAAIRDTGRALGLPYTFCDKVAKAIPMFTKLPDALANVKELKDLYNSDLSAKNLIDNALKLEGVARHSSTHACGVVISKNTLNYYTPCQYPPQNTSGIVTQYEMHNIEDLGLLKMDFLGLKNLTIIENALKIISKTKENKIDLAKIPLDDEKTLKLFQEGKTTGVFQFESSGMKRYLKKLKPTDFEDVVAMVALYRPGPLNSGMVDEFIDRKHGKKKIVYKHPIMENALKNTYGVIVYQEQVMQLSKDMASFTGGQADTLRKAMGKKIAELMAKMKEEFIEGCLKNKLDKKLAEETFSDMEKFAEYGFNRSHAVCYALIGYQTAYLKARYPAEFMASLLTADRENIDRIAIEVDECRQMEIEVLPPDVNKSFVNFGVINENGKDEIRFGLSAIKNVGHNIVETIVEERKENGTYESIEDFVLRVESKDLNKKSMESLIKTGAFDSMEERSKLLSNMERILNFAKEHQQAKNNGQVSLFGDLGSSENDINKLQLADTDPIDKTEKMAWEKELLGLYVSDHPLKDYSSYLRNNFKSTKDLTKEEVNQIVKVGGIITKIQKIITKSGKAMVFAIIEDLTGKIEVLVFPKLLESNQEIWEEGNIVSIKGKLSDKDGVFKLLCEEIRKIDLNEAKKYSEENEIKEDISENNNQDYRLLENNAGIIKDDGEKYSADKNIIEITVPKENSKEILQKLSDILKSAPTGNCEVYISVPSSDGGYQKIKTSKDIENGEDVVENIKNIVGDENLKLKPLT
ncbi:DNA polymerase III subunit alpha [Candidatus Parcubacteria bacterium]|nr:DNA polymerase III subunit alpha [Candidatus Parcubacteria bacterium]